MLTRCKNTAKIPNTDTDLKYRYRPSSTTNHLSTVRN